MLAKVLEAGVCREVRKGTDKNKKEYTMFQFVWMGEELVFFDYTNEIVAEEGKKYDLTLSIKKKEKSTFINLHSLQEVK